MYIGSPLPVPCTVGFSERWQEEALCPTVTYSAQILSLLSLPLVTEEVPLCLEGKRGHCWVMS